MPAKVKSLLRVLVLFGLMTVQAVCAQAERATFDLRQTDFAAGSVVDLQGEWHFKWGEFLPPDQASEAIDRNVMVRVEVPSRWGHYSSEIAQSSDKPGKATFIAHLALPENLGKPLVLLLPEVRDGYRLFWQPDEPDGSTRLLAEEGSLSAPQQVAQRMLTHPADISGSGFLVLHVFKETASRGGLRKAPQLSAAKPNNTRIGLKTLETGFVIGAMFLIVWNNMMLYLGHARDKAALILGLGTLGLMLRTLATSNAIEMAFGTEWYQFRYRLEIALMPLLAWAAAAINQNLSENFLPNWLMRSIAAASIGLACLTMVATFSILSPIVPIVQVHLLGVFGICIVRFAIGLLRREHKTGKLAFALFACAATGVNDVVVALSNTYQMLLAPYSILILMAVYSQAIFKRASESLARNAILEGEKEQLAKAHEDALFWATHDHLTGLMNRQGLSKALKERWADRRSQNQPASLVLFDVDHFKSVNDTFGHDIGDKVLIGLSRLLKEANLRRDDRFVRFGGEEFLLFLPDTSLAEATVIAERLRQTIASTPILGNPDELNLTCSFGVAETPDAATMSADRLLKLADEALYAAKHAGRNCVRAAERSIKIEQAA
ncbi:diguanylate cyclase (GGDEF)-like protein [Shimia isoporae]|uniref:diguanylate cyclase n=1 Tax=Shimia isoporae TaxID=647720 RepID=A0A4R1NL45_9RHOB|nr:GGDEF domain-containing protein [Shimia isoporae]TCL08825.1 diguanylate cyclase (GGDEF)-like protein [Shimia isoporae]